MKKTKKIIAAAILAMLTLTGCGTNPPYSDFDCTGKDAKEVAAAFKEAGFKTVDITEEETTEKGKDGTVSKVVIDGWTSFKEDSICNGDSLVTITKYTLASFEPTIEVETTGEDGWPEFIIKTNLPDKTKLTLTLSNDKDYTEQQTASVSDGEAKSDKFMDDKGLPLAGDYTLVVVMSPTEQKSKVQGKIGAAGETLKGELIETDKETGEQYIHYETAYHSPYTEGEIESALQTKDFDEVVSLVEQDIASAFKDEAGANYKVVPDEGGINITLWTEGTAEVAASAKMGDSTSKEIWEKLTKNALQASERIQKKYLNASGYSNKAAVVNIANDKDTDKVLFQAYYGMTIYDAVTGYGEQQ